VIKYIGSKRVLVDSIVCAVQAIANASTVVDLFSGTSRVGHALKKHGYRVVANDHNAYAHVLAQCYIEADRGDVEREATRLIAEFNRLPGKPGPFTETFCRRSRFFHPKNGERIDAIRDSIRAKGLEKDLEAVLLVSLMEAADRVDSTTGLQMAYLKEWAPRAHNDLVLRMPDVRPRARNGKGEAHRMDALDAACVLEGDIAYVDPPYNQHSYLANYHIWETLVLWDEPEVYGVACKRLDCRLRRSDFNSRRKFHASFARLISQIQAPVLIVSFSNEAFISREEVSGLLSRRGSVMVLDHDYKRYVGAQIGIYDPQGRKVGKVSHVRNTEHLFIVVPDGSAKVLQRQTIQPDRQLSLFSTDAPT